MEYREFGNSGEKLSRIGLGCFSMSGAYGAPDDAESTATIHRAIECGVNLVDTSASYGRGHNHRLIGAAIRDRRDKVFIHSKTGTIRTPDGRSVAEGSGTPARLREVCEQSLQGLGIETLDAFCMSRVDPTVPIEESVGGMARLVEEGKIRFIGLSEAAPDTVRRGAAVHPLVSLQFEFSLWTRDPEQDHLATCNDLGMALMGYAPLGYGFLTGAIAAPDVMEQGDTRYKFPRFQAENFAANKNKVAIIEAVAAERGATPAQIALAWLLSKGDAVFLIPGCKSHKHLEDNLAAVDITLSDEEITRLEDVFPLHSAAGNRYPDGGMARVNK
jgi:aryl-alcohol dehydrogenase-like predicted oxidoreductase